MHILTCDFTLHKFKLEQFVLGFDSGLACLDFKLGLRPDTGLGSELIYFGINSGFPNLDFGLILELVDLYIVTWLNSGLAHLALKLDLALN